MKKRTRTANAIPWLLMGFVMAFGLYSHSRYQDRLHAVEKKRILPDAETGLLLLDERVKRIERHLGIEPVTVK